MNRLSDCCEAPMTVESAEPEADYPTTCHYECQECGDPCDPAVSRDAVSTPLQDGGTATLEDGEMRMSDPPDDASLGDKLRHYRQEYLDRGGETLSVEEIRRRLDRHDPGPCERIGRYLDGLGRWMKHTLRLLQRRGIE